MLKLNPTFTPKYPKNMNEIRKLIRGIGITAFKILFIVHQVQLFTYKPIPKSNPKLHFVPNMCWIFRLYRYAALKYYWFKILLALIKGVLLNKDYLTNRVL